MSLSERSDEEISKLLTEYGIKHGPIVGKKSQHIYYFVHFVVTGLITPLHVQIVVGVRLRTVEIKIIVMEKKNASMISLYIAQPSCFKAMLLHIFLCFITLIIYNK